MAAQRPFRRRSIRLRGYDYGAPGSYFITVCTHRRAATLGQLSGAGVVLSAEGRALELVWHALPAHFPHVRLDAFVIMPDHFHGIIVIERRVGQPARRGGRPRGTEPGSLPAIVQSLKSVSARKINALRGGPGGRVWHEDYYERIVRSDGELQRVRRYIEANPRKAWESQQRSRR